MRKVLLGALLTCAFLTAGAGVAQAASALGPGDTGSRVVALQKRLSELGYFVGGRSGVYGTQTVQAVYALQKIAGIRRTGSVGQKTRRALRDGVEPLAQFTEGRVVQIDLRRQLMLLTRDGQVDEAINVSTGNGAYYGGGKRATTPTGTFSVYREIDGWHHAPLGTLYRPKYVVGGIAVHGSPSVPPYAASHGCIRVTNTAMDHLWRTGWLHRGAEIWIY
ncbi:L,D-transpeptidase family protein [Nonomuraea sp. NPDC050556]|uniref:L,D-transpeptidase family protein n=1 Tax=Nonomuraea sp. NPDC050556 TaxID=3364369 RepID=UPI0037BAC4AF